MPLFLISHATVWFPRVPPVQQQKARQHCGAQRCKCCEQCCLFPFDWRRQRKPEVMGSLSQGRKKKSNGDAFQKMGPFPVNQDAAKTVRYNTVFTWTVLRINFIDSFHLYNRDNLKIRLVITVTKQYQISILPFEHTLRIQPRNNVILPMFTGHFALTEKYTSKNRSV